MDFDLDNPPATAPGNAHPTVWALAHIVRETHVIGVDGYCVVCRNPRQHAPCPPLRTARRGFTLAVEMTRTPTPYSRQEA